MADGSGECISHALFDPSDTLLLFGPTLAGFSCKRKRLQFENIKTGVVGGNPGRCGIFM